MNVSLQVILKTTHPIAKFNCYCCRRSRKDKCRGVQEIVDSDLVDIGRHDGNASEESSGMTILYLDT